MKRHNSTGSKLEVFLSMPSGSEHRNFLSVISTCRKVDVRLPGRGNSNSFGERPVHLIITLMQWTRTSKVPIKKSVSPPEGLRKVWKLNWVHSNSTLGDWKPRLGLVKIERTSAKLYGHNQTPSAALNKFCLTSNDNINLSLRINLFSVQQ